MRKLNAQYRGMKQSADILSFPFFDELQAGDLPEVEAEDDMNLGDMVLSVPYVR